MKVRLNPEDGFKSPDGEEGARHISGSLGAMADAVPGLSPARLAARERLLDTIAQAMAGTLDRPPAAESNGWELRALNETHVQVILERAVTNKTLAELGTKYGFAPEYVGLLCKHPYARRIIAQVTGAMADRVDDVAMRIEQSAAEALEIKIALMRTSRHDMVRDRIASDILDRAGYGARRKIEVATSVATVIDSNEASELALALRESMQVAAQDYGQHLTAAKRPPQGDEATTAYGVGTRTDGQILLANGRLAAGGSSNQASPTRTPPALPSEDDGEDTGFAPLRVVVGDDDDEAAA